MLCTRQMLKSAEQKLPLQGNGEKPGGGIEAFVASHLLLQNIIRTWTLIFGLVHGKMRYEDTFLQLR